ncbi:hypothetical protein OE699_01835 [Sedimentimonas flavescens]|uniref:Uncharacterized protein n=1 Tax=Sedimentimonas flavescens TaxID=2851012 RepID=A0ABT2ZV11_9RHOB|nr:hypothetical protein [Sedimentimonas flavescens]MCV2877579.1 hypothetical protein [Sedimentimonas flavescens]
MTDKPILFNGPMVRTILEGRKTQTRRVIKPQLGDIARAFQFVPGKWRFLDHSRARVHQLFSPPFSTGDRLWVREAHFLTNKHAYRLSVGVDQSINPDDDYQACVYAEGFDLSRTGMRLRPSIHMPRWASRLTLIVEDVRVQRLQDISEADAKSEGCDAEQAKSLALCDGAMPGNSKRCFHWLWNSINGPEAWDANPWVAAITFRAIRANIDSPEARA